MTRPRSQPSVFFAPLLLLGSMLSLTLGASIAKGLFPVLGAAGVTFLRLGIGTVILFAVWRPWRARIPREQRGIIVVYGVVLGVMNLGFYEAIARLPVGIAIALEFLGPLSLAFFMSKGRLDVLWAMLALAGVVLLLPLTQVQARLDVVGIVFALAAGAAWAAYIVVGKKAGADSHPGSVTALGMLMGTLTAAPFGVVPVGAAVWTPAMALAALAVGLLSSAIPFSLEMAAMRHLDSKTFGILVSLEPAFGAVAAFLLLHERLTWVQCLAIAGVMAASIGSTVTSRKEGSKDVVLN
ncbi:MAG TPA: EamA family transporter [Prosthecobacter sp.]